jgi:predicted Zn finger-like uncharacterized protein
VRELRKVGISLNCSVMMEKGSMHIVCPHCTTSYAIKLETLGPEGRTVRCSRCKEVWLARPKDAVEPVAAEPVMAEASRSPERQADLAAQWSETAAEETPVVDSPSIAGDFPGDRAGNTAADWAAMASDDSDSAAPRKAGPFDRLFGRAAPRSRGKSLFNLTTAAAAMGALVVALFVWRADVVRLLPQTAAFYKLVGLDVNLRGLLFKDVKVTTETVEGKPVLVIEGVIVGESRKTVDLPRLRFSVRDAQGAEIYAWNTVLEQTRLQPGGHAFFKSRLASPPAEGRSIDVRFFNGRDVAGGSV